MTRGGYGAYGFYADQSRIKSAQFSRPLHDEKISTAQNLHPHSSLGHSERRLSNFLKRFSLTNGERPAKNLVTPKKKVSRFFVGLRTAETEKDFLS